MNMKKTLIASALGLMAMSATLTAQACGCFGPGQGPGRCSMMQADPYLGGGGRGPRGVNPGGGIDSHLARMTAMLGLSPEQQNEMRAILEAQEATRQAMRGAMQDAMREQVDAILTPEQRVQHHQLMQARDQSFGGRGGGRCGHGRGPGQGWGPGAGFGPVPPASPGDGATPAAPIPAN